MTVGLFEFYEASSPLHRRNPFIKLVALGIIMLVVTLDLKPSTPWFDPGVPLVFLALVVGGEAEGATQESRQAADGLVQIPMPGGCESLNAAIAASILLFEIVRQRSTL